MRDCVDTDETILGKFSQMLWYSKCHCNISLWGHFLHQYSLCIPQQVVVVQVVVVVEVAEVAEVEAEVSVHKLGQSSPLHIHR